MELKEIEEKAKAYDEASKWMEGIYPTLTHEQQMEAEAFFQIFKESEDEKIRKELIAIYSVGAKANAKTGDIPDRDIVAWLEKQGEQKSVWSVEDNERIEQICEDLSCGLKNFHSGKNVKGLHFDEIIKSNIDWLKELKDRVQHQNTWKPSDEQMDALHYVTNFDYGGHKATLASLYKDLKKLKG